MSNNNPLITRKYTLWLNVNIFVLIYMYVGIKKTAFLSIISLFLWITTNHWSSTLHSVPLFCGDFLASRRNYSLYPIYRQSCYIRQTLWFNRYVNVCALSCPNLIEIPLTQVKISLFKLFKIHHYLQPFLTFLLSFEHLLYMDTLQLIC